MHKIAVVLVAMAAMLFAGLLAWNAEATTVGAAVAFGAKNYSPLVIEAGCQPPRLQARDTLGLSEKGWVLVRRLSDRGLNGPR